MWATFSSGPAAAWSAASSTERLPGPSSLRGNRERDPRGSRMCHKQPVFSQRASGTVHRIWAGETCRPGLESGSTISKPCNLRQLIYNICEK